MWMQPGASSEVMRTFVVPRDGTVKIEGELRKDPSAENGRTLEARIDHNGRTVWPESGWARVAPEFERPVRADVERLPVRKGDTIRFIIRRTGVNEPDPVIWSPRITMRDSQ
jgi:hypothetical protein